MLARRGLAEDHIAIGLTRAQETELFEPEVFDQKKFNDSKIKLSFIKHKLNPYIQNNNNFIEGLSIIDILMFNSPNNANKIIDQYEIL